MTIRELALVALAKHPILRLKAENYQSAVADAILFADVEEEEEEVFVREDLSMDSLYRGLEDLEIL